MRLLEARITGIAPFLHNRFLVDQDEENESESSKKRKQPGRKFSISEHREMCLDKIYRDDQIGIYCPAVNIKKCMIAGARLSSLKYGKKAITTFMEALVFISPERVSFGKTVHDYIDERPGRIPPRTGARVMLYRPAFSGGWQLEFNIEIVDDRLPIDNIKLSLEEGGILNGLGDGRPNFGRFTVKWLKEPK